MAVPENQSENQPNPKQPLQTGVLSPGIGGAYWSGIVVYFGAEYPLEENFGMSPQDTVADIGAGTGISSRLFLEKNYTVIAVEPNASVSARPSTSLLIN